MARRLAAAALALLTEVHSDALTLLQTQMAKVPPSDGQPVQGGVAHIGAEPVLHQEMLMQPEKHAQLDSSLLETGATVAAHHLSSRANGRVMGKAHSFHSRLSSRLRQVLALAAGEATLAEGDASRSFVASESHSASDSSSEVFDGLAAAASAIVDGERGGLQAYGGDVVDLVKRGWRHSGAKTVEAEVVDLRRKPDGVLVDAFGEPLKGLDPDGPPVAEPTALELQHRAHLPSWNWSFQQTRANVTDNYGDNVTQSILAAARAELAQFDDALSNASGI